ncbi:MAG: phosphate acyltransferase, partial [Fibrobacterota bacterium]
MDKPVKLIQDIFENAKKLKRTIVLPEGDDVRTLQAARMAVDAGIAKIIVVDVDGKTRGLARDNKIALDNI